MNIFTRSIVATLCVASALPLAGCITYHGEYSVLSNRVLDLDQFEPRKAVAKRVYAEGKAVRRIISYVADRNDHPRLEEAIDRALEEGEGDVILNAQVLGWDWYIPLIYGSSGWKVVGDVINTGSGGAKVRNYNSSWGSPFQVLGVSPF